MKTMIVLIALAVLAFVAYRIIRERMLMQKAQQVNAVHLVPETEIPPHAIEIGAPEPAKPAFDPLAEDHKPESQNPS